MTRQLDIEQLLDIWLDDGPTDAADAAFDMAVARVYRQRQRPAWRLLWKEPHVTTPIKFAVGAAATFLLLVTGFAVLGGFNAKVGGQPAPTTIPSPTASLAAAELPTGRLAAGDYIMRTIPSDPMKFVITVPDGWIGFSNFFVSGPGSSDAPDGFGIAVLHNPEVTTDPCDSSTHTPSPDASRPPSVDDLAAALSSRTDLQPSAVTDTTLAGYAGKRLDVQLQTSSDCSNYYVFAEPQGLYSNGAGNRWRIWLLDVAGETAVVVQLDYAGTPAADRAAAEAAIEGLRITNP